MAFVLDVNLRIQDILGLQKVGAALSQVQNTLQPAQTGGGSAAGAIKAQATAATGAAAAVQSLMAATNQLNAAQKITASTVQNTSQTMGRATVRAKDFGDSMQLAFKRYAAYTSATIGPLLALKGLSQATNSVIELDHSMVQLKQITGETDQRINEIRTNILDLSVATGTATSEISRVAKVMAQAGYTGKQLDETVSILSKIPLAPTFESMDVAIEGTIAALNQFSSEGLTATKVLDVMTVLSNKFAVESQDIAQGVARGGAAFAAIGGSYEEFAAIFTTIRHVTREGAESIGTFLKTISARLADPKIVEFLAGKGIRIGEAIQAGDPVSAFKQIAAGLANITGVQEKMEIANKLGGQRQVSRLLALVNNTKLLDETLRAAASSSGEFDKVAQEGLKSLYAQLSILGAEFGRLVQELAQPFFIPLIKHATEAGHAFVTILDAIRPVLPVMATLVGYAGLFKILALSISGVGAAIGGLSKVSFGILPSFQAAIGSGGVAGATAKTGLTQAAGASGATTAVAAGAGAKLAQGAKTLATSQLGQLAVVAGIITAASSLSESFAETGRSSGLLASEFVKAVGTMLLVTSLLTGQSVTGAIGGLVAALGPVGAAATAAVVALGALTYASVQAVDSDVQGIIKAVTKKVSEASIEPIETTGDLEKTAGQLGRDTLSGITETAKRYEDGLSGFFASSYERVANLFKGEGLVTISDTQATQIIDDIVGANPQLLNNILRKAIEEFGSANIESSLDEVFMKESGASAEAAAALRQAMIKQLGGLEKVSQSFANIKIDKQSLQLTKAIEKVAKSFEEFYTPAELSSQLGLLSEAVGRAAKSIEMNVTLFDQLSQNVGRSVGIVKPEGEFTTKAVEQIFREGKTGDLIDLSQFSELEGFTTDMASVGKALQTFMQSIIASKAQADSLRSRIVDQKVDPFDIINEYIDQFISEYPQQLPPDAVDAFRTAAQNLGGQLNVMLSEQAGVLPTAEEVQHAFESVLGKQQPFYEAAVNVFKTWLDAQVQQLNLSLSGEELLGNVDVGTTQLKDTLVHSLGQALDLSGIQHQLPVDYASSTGEVTSALINIADGSDLVGRTMDKYKDSYARYAELVRSVSEAQQTGEGVTIELFQAYKRAAVEVVNLQIALTQLEKAAQQAPQALTELLEKRKLAQETGETFFTPWQIPTEPVGLQKFVANLDQSSKEMSEYIQRQRQFIEAGAAIEVAQVYKEPADIFAEALRKSADAVHIFTEALTVEHLLAGAKVLSGSGTRVESQLPVEKSPQTQQLETEHLQSALFGASMDKVIAALSSAANQLAIEKAGQADASLTGDSAALMAIADRFRNFDGSGSELAKQIQDSGLDSTEIVNQALERLKLQSTELGAKEVENIGILQRTVTDLRESLETLIARPEVADKPELISDQLSPALKQYLQNLSSIPTEQVLPSPTPVYQPLDDEVVSASQIQQAAIETATAASLTSSSADRILTASTDIQSGGSDVLAASQRLAEAAYQMQTVIDVQRQVAPELQETSNVVSGGEGVREAVTETTIAVNSLGDRMDAVARAVETQTATLAVQAPPIVPEIPGLSENTAIIAENTTVSSQSQTAMLGLNDGMTRIAGALEEGLGIDLETISTIKVDVQGVGAAAKEFTAEFESIATRIAKAQINEVLQKLARASSNSELANTFESTVS